MLATYPIITLLVDALTARASRLVRAALALSIKNKTAAVVPANNVVNLILLDR